MKISVIIPSRCDIDPRSHQGELFLLRALQSIQAQTVKVHEVCIGVQERTPQLQQLAERYTDRHLHIVQTNTKGQAAALNAAAAFTGGDVIAFLEDDDEWQPRRLFFGLKVMQKLDCEFVSSNQLMVNLDGQVMGINDFPTPSGWLMSAALWRRLGGFDESFRWHLDTDFLGKLFKTGVKRAHLVEQDAHLEDRDWLQQVARFSRICRTSETGPLVSRLDNPKGGMSTIGVNPVAKSQSASEHQSLLQRYGMIPW